MAKTSINPTKAAEAAATPVVERTPDAGAVADLTPVVREESAALMRLDSVQVGGMDGEFTPKDLVIPRLEVVQALGPNSEKFPGGTVIFNKTVTLAKFALTAQDKEQPLNIVALYAKKFIEEVLEYDPNGPLPRTWPTTEAAKAAGMRTEWGPKGADGKSVAPQVRDVANLLVLIQQPEGMDPVLFPFEDNGKRFAVAMWTVRGTAYRKVAKVMFSNMHFALRGNLASGTWTMVVKRETMNGKLVYVPTIALTATTSPTLIAMVKEMMAGKNISTDNGAPHGDDAPAAE